MLVCAFLWLRMHLSEMTAHWQNYCLNTTHGTVLYICTWSVYLLRMSFGRCLLVIYFNLICILSKFYLTSKYHSLIILKPHSSDLSFKVTCPNFQMLSSHPYNGHVTVHSYWYFLEGVNFKNPYRPRRSLIVFCSISAY